MLTWRVLTGDARERLAELDAGSVHTCVTSPPYFGLRDYATEGQIGLEPTPDEYVAALVDVFREVRRVLRDDGTVWLNLGDSFCSTDKWGGGVGGNTGKHTVNGADVPSWAVRSRKQPMPGVKPKDLLGIPWMVAFALRQPYEVVAIKDRVDRAWLAALIDGEGCITTTVATPTTGTNESYGVVIVVRMSEWECLDRIVEITGMSKVQDEAHYPSNHGPVFSWKVSGENAATLLAEVYPYLRIKRQQAVAAWNLQRLKDGITTKRGVAIPVANMEMRRELHRVLRALNQREPVDVPGWCAEPTYTVEPGWYLRSDVIWSKPNPMPESVTDRPTKAHEYLFLLSKAPSYFYDADAIREQSDPRQAAHDQRYARIYDGPATDPANGQPGNVNNGGIHSRAPTDGRANKRSVWTVATQPYPGAHFATFAPKLIEPCVLAGAPERACGECGAPWERVVEREEGQPHTRGEQAWTNGSGTFQRDNPGGGLANLSGPSRTLGFAPSCIHNADSVPGVVLDPFAGAGTTGMVALRHNRSFVGIELNPEYADMARWRIRDDAPLLNHVSEVA
jgi:DNA modification methylase